MTRLLDVRKLSSIKNSSTISKVHMDTSSKESCTNDTQASDLLGRGVLTGDSPVRW